MKQLKKDIQAVSKSLKALAQKTEKMMKRVSELEKVQAKAKPRKAAKKPAAGKAAAKKKLPRQQPLTRSLISSQRPRKARALLRWQNRLG